MLDRLALIRLVGFPGAVETVANVLWKASLENEVEYPATGAKASGHAVRSVMIKVMLLHIAEVGITKIAEVRRMVNPFFRDVRLVSRRHHNRGGERRKQKNTQWHKQNEKRQQVTHSPAHVLAVERFLVMAKMSRVEIFVGQDGKRPFEAPLRNFPMTMQHKPVGKVLD